MDGIEVRIVTSGALAERAITVTDVWLLRAASNTFTVTTEVDPTARLDPALNTNEVAFVTDTTPKPHVALSGKEL